MNMRWNQIAISVAVGFLAGALFSDFYHMHIKRRPPKAVPEEGAIERCTRELDLSKQQQDQVAAIFKEYRPKVRGVKDSIRPALEGLRLKIKSELRSVLTQMQYSKLEKLDDESRRTEGPPPMREGPGDSRLHGQDPPPRR